jgi:hypothetical protein
LIERMIFFQNNLHFNLILVKQTSFNFHKGIVTILISGTINLI